MPSRQPRGCFVILFVVALAFAQTAGAQEVTILFDENDNAGSSFREASAGVAEGGDQLLLIGDKLPLSDSAFSGSTSGLLASQHVPGGRWEMVVGTEAFAPVDLASFDTLALYLNAPEAIPGAELPRIGLRDADGNDSAVRSVSIPTNVHVESSSGFTDESQTNAVLTVVYVDVLPSTLRRPGYPEELAIAFSDVPLDTSVAAIGAPATPSKFKVTTASGLQLDFRFRDTNADGTLSASGEYIDVLTPIEEGSDQQRQTWRFELASVSPDLIVPTSGDVYGLDLSWDEFSLDADPASWQRIAIPLVDFADDGFAFDGIVASVFSNGGLNDTTRTLWFDHIEAIRNDDEAFLDEVQRLTFDYFWLETNTANGLVRDRTHPNSASSIAAVGFGLSAYTVGIDRGWITREEGVARVLNTLRFFWTAPQGTQPDVTGYKGFFYHFLDMNTGRRAGTTELSTIDTALLLAGVLHVGEYFDAATGDETEIRQLADSLYRRVDWQWAVNNEPLVSLAWKPDEGFSNFDWRGYNEAMIIYILGIGSPTYPLDPTAWSEWTSTYQWESHYGYSFVRFPPLFGHQYTHVWVDFRGIQDDYMRARGIDYFENSRRATLAQRAYHVANPRGYSNYDRDEWGLTASQVPDGYRARGAPPAQNDDGTLAPTAPGGSIVFTPDESIAALRTMRSRRPGVWGKYGFRDAYNVSELWYSTEFLGIDQGPILLMIENHLTGRIWERFMQNEHVQRGLELAGFRDTDTGFGENEPDSEQLELAAPYPNPFDQTVQLEFVLPTDGRARVSVFDILGRRVAIITDRWLAAGPHGVTWTARGAPSGVYYITLDFDDQTVTRAAVRARR